MVFGEPLGVKVSSKPHANLSWWFKDNLDDRLLASFNTMASLRHVNAGSLITTIWDYVRNST